MFPLSQFLLLLSKPTNILHASSSCILFCLLFKFQKDQASKALLSVFLPFSCFSDFHPSSFRLGVNVLPTPQALQGIPPRDVALKIANLEKRGSFQRNIRMFKNSKLLLKKYILEHYQNCHNYPTRIYPPYPLSVASSLQGSGASRSFDADKAEFEHGAKLANDRNLAA